MEMAMSSSSVVDQLQYDRPPLPSTPISFEDFMAWAEGNTHVEWVDGEITLLSPNNLEHHRVLGFLYRLIDAYVRTHQLGEVFLEGVLMRLRTRPSGREPDLLFVAAEHADRLRPTYVDGPADLAVEIVSPDSTERDRVTKLAEYEAAGVPEYWVIDPLYQEADFCQLGADGRYHPISPDSDGVYHSAVLPDFWLQVAWLWQRPFPAVGELVREIES